MSLIDDLRKLGAAFPPSHVPSAQELPGVVGALVTLIEHGPDLLTHLESDYETVAKFVSGVADDVVPDAPAVPAPSTTPGASADHPASTPAADNEQVSALQAQVAQLLAANQSLQEQITAQAAAARTVAADPAPSVTPYDPTKA